MRVRVTAPSRLHFGLLRLPASSESNLRAFGGAGLMTAAPGLQLHVEPAREWSAQGPLAARALQFAQTFLARSPEIRGGHAAFALTVVLAPSEHIGLGTGTQLGMAVAQALSTSLGLRLTVDEMAQRVERGERSALGVHGFEHGGFIVDGGKGPHTRLAPLVARLPFPDDWRVLLAAPKNAQGVHGAAERHAFAELTTNHERTTDMLCRLVLLEMMPAVVERDLPAFSAALYEFNRRVGVMFQPWQGGIYANAETAALVQQLRDLGITGVGQSSWGPTVFAIVHAEQVQRIADALTDRASVSTVVTMAANEGAKVVCD